VFSSTAAVYGTPQQIPILEDAAKIPINPYGESKWFTERAMEAYGKAYGLRTLALRYFNASGADASGAIGEAHDPETHLVPLIILAALGRRECVRLFGTDYPTPDGTALRDYIHVTDLARAHVMGIEYLKNGGPSTAINVGAGSGYSVREVIRAVERLSGLSVPVQEGPRRAGDPPSLVAAAGKAQQILGWTPQHSSLDEIVESALAWHRKREAQTGA
jgi:UDP-glucose-4-epimerase GalE